MSYGVLDGVLEHTGALWGMEICIQHSLLCAHPCISQTPQHKSPGLNVGSSLDPRCSPPRTVGGPGWGLAL